METVPSGMNRNYITFLGYFNDISTDVPFSIPNEKTILKPSIDLYVYLRHN